MKSRQTLKLLPLTMAGSILVLSACSSSDDDVNNGSGLTNDDPISYAYSFNRTPFATESSGRIERISLTDGNVVDGQYPATSTDHALSVDDNSVYQIGRFNIDNLTKFDPINTSAPDFQISLINEGDSTTNPQALVFASEDLAYLTQRASNELLIIDPTPDVNTTESLITGRISLADYSIPANESDTGVPEMTDALIVGNNLYVLMENLQGGTAPVNPGFLAVFDIRNNQEIQTGEAAIPFRGIQLEMANPTGLQFNEQTGMVYVVGRGNIFNNTDAPGDPFTGGIEVINPISFESTILINDGTAENNNGHFENALVINNDLAYVMTALFDENFNSTQTLRTINLSTGELSEPIAGTQDLTMTNMAIGPDNHLWVGFQSDTPGYVRIDLETGIMAPEMVATSLIPVDIVFLEVTP